MRAHPGPVMTEVFPASIEAAELEPVEESQADDESENDDDGFHESSSGGAVTRR